MRFGTGSGLIGHIDCSSIGGRTRGEEAAELDVKLETATAARRGREEEVSR